MPMRELQVGYPIDVKSGTGQILIALWQGNQKLDQDLGVVN